MMSVHVLGLLSVQDLSVQETVHKATANDIHVSALPPTCLFSCHYL